MINEAKNQDFDQRIHDFVACDRISPETMDDFLASAWRPLGGGFVRHNRAISLGAPCFVCPLRIRLKDFVFSKSQKKLLRKSRNLLVECRPAKLTAVHVDLFEAHKRRFEENIPVSIFGFLNFPPSISPTTGIEHAVYNNGKLIAASFMHLGLKGVSSTYCIFDPDWPDFRLGVLTMLREIEWCIEHGFEHYYLGYSYDMPSPFDYKYNFYALERYDWKNNLWVDQERIPLRNWRQEFKKTTANLSN